MSYRALQPRACVIAANVDLDHSRQAREEQPVGMPLATEIATDELRDLAPAAQLHRVQMAREVFAKQRLAVDQGPRRAVAHRVGVAVRNDYDIARNKGHGGGALEPGQCRSFGDQMIADQTFGSRSQHMRNALHVRHRESPRRGAYGVEEDGARHVDRA
jgi:hypothetical protein